MEKRIRLVFCILSVVVTVFVFGFSFTEMFYGAATIAHLLVSLLFILVWLGLAILARQSAKILEYIGVFWAFIFLTFLASCLLEYVYAFIPILHELGVILLVIFYPPFFGLTYFVGDASLFPAILLLAAAFLVYSIVCTRRLK